MNTALVKKAPIGSSTSVMLWVVFRPEKIEKYRAKGVDVKSDGSAVFGGTFQSFENSKPCFKISAHAEAEVFDKRKSINIPLDWESADVLSVGCAFQRDKFLWKAEWGEKEFIEAHGHYY